MRFTLYLGNLSGTAHVQQLDALVRYLRDTISACGHDVVLSLDQMDEGGVNLCFEHFADAAWVDGMARLRAAGLRPAWFPPKWSRGSTDGA